MQFCINNPKIIQNDKILLLVSKLHPSQKSTTTNTRKSFDSTKDEDRKLGGLYTNSGVTKSITTTFLAMFTMLTEEINE